MASVASASASPLSGHEMPAHRSTASAATSYSGDYDDESWLYVDPEQLAASGGPGSGSGGSTTFYSASPASAASFGSSYAVIALQRRQRQSQQQQFQQSQPHDHPGQLVTSTTTPQRHMTGSPLGAVSPLSLNAALSPAPPQQQMFSPPPPATTTGVGAMFGGDLLEGTTTSAFAMPSLDAPDNSFLSTGNLGFFTQEQMNDPTFLNFMPQIPSILGLEALNAVQPQHNTVDLGIPGAFQSPANVGPWGPTSVFGQEDGSAGANNALVMDEFLSASPPSYPSRSESVSNHSSIGGPHSPAGHIASIGPESPNIKHENSGSEGGRATVDDSFIHKVKGVSHKVEKKATTAAVVEPASKFVIMTPNIISAHAHKPNPWECFEAIRTTARGRKGPLATDTKENARLVRRKGACFCCHSRKVKCDQERPCRNCKKLMMAVPQIVCWQFQDFLTVLFPDFIRGHFRKEEMQRFVAENIDSFRVDGVDKPCTVELFSGARFSTILTVGARFFTAKTPEVLQHWHLQVGGRMGGTTGAGATETELQSRGSAPIGVDLDNAAQRDELRRRAKKYIANIVTEPFYAEQVTDAIRHTDVPRRLVKIVQNFAMCSESPIVRRALSIYSMHYVMTRQLCLTQQSILNLQRTGQVPQNVPWVTPRVLNRQIKSIIDDMLMRETQQLFEAFSKSLKEKSRREWAPCLAGFLLLCLFMESLETAAHRFVNSQNEVNARHGYEPGYGRDFARRINREVENLPFKQFAYQFHQIYQTHSRDANARPFNPLVDDALLDGGDLDGPAVIMVAGLKELLQGENWAELDFLSMDPVEPLSSGDDDADASRPYRPDVSLNYTARLVSKFLLSFTDDRYIFDQQP